MHVSYLDSLFKKEEQNKVINRFKEIDQYYNFESIAVCGISGVGIGAILSNLFDKKLIVIRKTTDINHSPIKVESRYYYTDKFNYLIIDDLVSSSRSLFAMKTAMHNFLPNGNCVGVFQYALREMPIDQLKEFDCLFDHLSFETKNEIEEFYQKFAKHITG